MPIETLCLIFFGNSNSIYRQVTCPCCREHPPVLEPSAVPSVPSVPSLSNMQGVNVVNIVQGRHTVEVTRRPVG